MINKPFPIEEMSRLIRQQLDVRWFVFLGDFASWRETLLTLRLKGMSRKAAKDAKGEVKK